MTWQINKVWVLLLTILGCLLPLLMLFIDIALDKLGANPIQALHIRLGDWALRFLWLTLAITPLQTISQWRGMTYYRQLFGLYSFFYATLHLLVYVIVDQAMRWRLIVIDIVESRYIWFGVLAYCILFALAITSPKFAKKKLGKQWKPLHRLIYMAGGAAIIHYFWQLKGNLAEPLFYLLILCLLLLFRVLVWLKNRQLTKLMIPKRRV
jgi:sulfoxide reductase heme-binding subunit YedZ